MLDENKVDEVILQSEQIVIYEKDVYKRQAYISINNDVLIFTYPTVSLLGTEERRGWLGNR